MEIPSQLRVIYLDLAQRKNHLAIKTNSKFEQYFEFRWNNGRALWHWFAAKLTVIYTDTIYHVLIVHVVFFDNLVIWFIACSWLLVLLLRVLFVSNMCFLFLRSAFSVSR